MSILLIGDIHGALNSLHYELKTTIQRNSTFIQVGDFGAGYMKHDNFVSVLGEINKVLELKNNTLLVIRGNHDNPSYFDGNFKFSNIEFLADYTIRKVEDKNILFIGGAISIDRSYSIKNKRPYWPNEVVDFDFEILKTIKGIDMVVTHTAPNFVEPFGVDAPIVNNYAQYDSTLKIELMEERNNFGKAYSILNENNHIKHWFFGHFHFSNAMYYNSTKFILLDIGEYYEMKQNS